MNAKGKSIDTTSLHLVGHTAIYGEIHRDYLAHCLRYSHVARYLNEGKRCSSSHILDVGCGSEAPLARLLRSMMMVFKTGSYTGVDYGPVAWPWPKTSPEKARTRFIERADFATVELPRDEYDAIVCFEVLEHVEPLHAFTMLKRMAALLRPKGAAFISTPCYDSVVGPAKNHVNEMSFNGLEALLWAAGFEVERVWGTFASQKDYKGLLKSRGIDAELWSSLSSYYDSSVLSCLFAPLFPERARNCIWKLRSGDRPVLLNVAERKRLAGSDHGSSERWPKDFMRIMKEVENATR
jgi:SAM-dependent methyltransferase